MREGADVVAALRRVPAETIARKQALLRRYGPMLDFDCDYERGCDAASGALQAALTAALQSAQRLSLRVRALQRAQSEEVDAAELLAHALRQSDALAPLARFERLRHPR